MAAKFLFIGEIIHEETNIHIKKIAISFCGDGSSKYISI